MAIDFNSIFQQIMASQTAANAANVQRYNEILSSLGTLGQQVGGRYTAAAGELAQLGQAGRTRIETGATKAVAATEQDLITRGLGASTIRMTAQRGIMSDAERARQELEEGIAAQRAGLSERWAGAEMQIGGMKAGVMERRADVGPDLGLYASLLQAAAASERADAATARRTSTIMGPMAQAGRDVFGQPFKYGGGGGGGLGGQGGGISGGGGGGPTGGGLTGSVTGASRTFDAAGGVPEGGPGGIGFFGQQGFVSTAPAGEQPYAPGADVGGEMSMQRTLTESEQNVQALLEAEGIQTGAPTVEGGAFSVGGAAQETGGPFKTYEEYVAFQKKVGRSIVNKIAWTYSAANAARAGS